MSNLKEIGNKLFKKSQEVELGAIEDAIKQKQTEAERLSNKLNGYAANARDVSSAISRAETKYKQAKRSFELFKSLEEEVNDEIDFANKFHDILKREGFKALNDFDEANDELKKYGANIKGFKDNSKELLKADADWKTISSKFKKIK
tara:strand:- start:452 stop:892 length:441 start_codon:yes stop_codon:yes gene_type:complete